MGVPAKKATEASSAEQVHVRRIVAGEREHFRWLIEKYQHLICHIVFPLISDPHARQEAIQEIFIKIYQGLPSFRADCRLSTWIGRIAYHHALNMLRKSGRRMPLEILDGTEQPKAGSPQLAAVPRLNGEHGAGQPDIELEAQERQAILSQALEWLPPVMQSVIRLYHLDGLSVREIAGIMQAPVGTIKSHLFRARKALKQQLLKTYQPEEVQP